MNPYPGLRPFSGGEEANFYFGREAVGKRLHTRVRISPLTVIFARSGVGKSSFLTCRLIPALEKESRIIYINEWGGKPPEEIIQRRLENSKPDRKKYREVPLLILDQFEDIFKFAYRREELWETLASLVNVSKPEAHLLVSMREEWLGSWAEGRDFLPDSFESMIRLKPLNRVELKTAVVEPARREGRVQFADELAEQMLRDLTTPHAFGLAGKQVEPGPLQLVCSYLWEYAAERNVSQVEPVLYQELGGADQIIRRSVWEKMRLGGKKAVLKKTADRMLLVGIIPSLIHVHGSKAIVSANSLLQDFRLQNLGAAALAVVKKAIDGKCLKFLKTDPLLRGESVPKKLKDWFWEVLNIAVEMQFLKKQKGLPTEEEAGGEGKYNDLFELSHDSLGDVLLQFAAQFKRKIHKIWKFWKLSYVSLLSLLVLIGYSYYMLAITKGQRPDVLVAIRSAEFWATFGLMGLGFLIIIGVGILFYRLVRNGVIFPVTRLLLRANLKLK